MKEYTAPEFYHAVLLVKYAGGYTENLHFDETLTFNEARAQVEGAKRALASYSKDVFFAGGIVYRCQPDPDARGGFIVCDEFREDTDRLVWLKVRK